MSLVQKDPSLPPTKQAQAQPPPAQKPAAPPPTFVTSGTDYQGLLRDYPSSKGYVINWEGVTSSGESIWGIFKDVQYPAAPETPGLLRSIFAGAGPQGSQQLIATGSDKGALQEQYPGYIVALSADTTREGLPLYSVYAPPGGPPRQPTAPELFMNLSQSLKPQSGGGFSLDVSGQTVKFTNLGEAQSFIGSYIAGANIPLFTSGGGGGTLYFSQTEAENAAKSQAIFAAIATIKPAPLAKSPLGQAIPDSSGYSAMVGGTKYYFTSPEEATAFINNAYLAPGGVRFPQVQLAGRVYSFASMGSALSYIYAPSAPTALPKIDPITTHPRPTKGGGFEGGITPQAETDRNLILQNMVGPFPYPVTVTRGGIVIGRFMSMSEANTFIARLNAPAPIGTNLAPAWTGLGKGSPVAFVGTFLTGAYRTPEFIERDVESFSTWGRAQPNPVVRAFAGAFAGIGAIGVGATSLFTGNINPALTLAAKEPGLIPGEIVGAGLGLYAFGGAYSGFEKATGIASLGLKAQTGLRAAIGAAVGGGAAELQGSDIPTGWIEGGLVFAGLPLVFRGVGFTIKAIKPPVEEPLPLVVERGSTVVDIFASGTIYPKGSSLLGTGKEGLDYADLEGRFPTKPVGFLETKAIETPSGELLEAPAPTPSKAVPPGPYKGTPAIEFGTEERDLSGPMRPMKSYDIAEIPVKTVSPAAMTETEFEEAFRGTRGVDYAKSLAETRGSSYEYAGIEPSAKFLGYPMRGAILDFVPLTTPPGTKTPTSALFAYRSSFVPITESSTTLGFDLATTTKEEAALTLQSAQTLKSVPKTEALPAFETGFRLEDSTRLDLASNTLTLTKEESLSAYRVSQSEATKEAEITETTTLRTRLQAEAFTFDFRELESGRYQFPSLGFPTPFSERRTKKRRVKSWDYWEQVHAINIDPSGIFGRRRRKK